MAESIKGHYNEQYRPDIDGLRAIAVLAVIFYHNFSTKLPGGFVGVDIFFVISGFLISRIIFKGLQEETFRFSSFYSRRIVRLIPSLFVVLIFVLVFGWFILLHTEYKQIGKHVAAGAGSIANLSYSLESTEYFDTPAIYKPLLHLWSLGVEEQFYLTFPILLYFCWSRRLNLTSVVLGLFALSVMTHFLWNFFSWNSFYSPITRFWEILAGVIIALRRSRDAFWTDPLQSNTKAANLLALGGIFAITLSFWHVQPEKPIELLLPVSGAMMLILAGTDAFINRHILSNQVLVAIGLISYPLYLWHWPLLFCTRIFWGNSPYVRLFSIALSLIFGALTYRFIECPIRFGRWSLQIKTRACLSAAILLITTGTTIYWTGGIPRRQANHADQTFRLLHEEPYCDEAGLQYAGQALQKYRFGYCRYTDAQAKNTIAIIGDSHAFCAYSGMTSQLSSLRLNTLLLGTGGAPPFVSSDLTIEKDPKRATYLRAMFDILITRKDIRSVFIFTRGPVYITGFDESSGKRTASCPEIPLQTYQTSLQKTVDLLSKAGKKVYIVTENPELPFTIEAYSPRPFIKTQPIPLVLKENVIKRQKDYLLLLSEIQGAYVINVLDAFFAGEESIVFKEGKFLYADDNHLSDHGSRLQAEYIFKNYLFDLEAL